MCNYTMILDVSFRMSVSTEKTTELLHVLDDLSVRICFLGVVYNCLVVLDKYRNVQTK